MKYSQQQVRYRRGRLMQRCAICHMYEKTARKQFGSCTEVTGQITPFGMCDLFKGLTNPFGNTPMHTRAAIEAMYDQARGGPNR